MTFFVSQLHFIVCVSLALIYTIPSISPELGGFRDGSADKINIIRLPLKLQPKEIVKIIFCFGREEAYLLLNPTKNLLYISFEICYFLSHAMQGEVANFGNQPDRMPTFLT